MPEYFLLMFYCLYILLILVVYLFYTGMDAQVAYGFHHLRDEKPYLAQGPISNKVKLSTFLSISCTSRAVMYQVK